MEEQELPNEPHTTEAKNEPAVQPEQPKEKSETELLNERLAELEKQSAVLKDQVLRKAAEFENYKRRTENETLSLAKYAGESIITQLLPILDDLSRSLKSGKEKFESDPFYKGVELIYNKFVKQLEGQGLKPLETVGKEFNVDYHDALMQVPRADVPPHTIIEEVESGYMLFDKVIRHAKVIVSTSAAQEEVKS
ncbi:MAG: nucleotide exchange factor GrpE [Bacteroidota bacterium]|jgi:molecular chaperone GrpE